MRILLKTDYQQDIRLFSYGGERLFFAGLALYALWLAGASSFLNAQAMSVAAVIYALGFGAMLLRPSAGGWLGTSEGGGDAFWYGLLAIGAASAPFLLDDYNLGQLIFVYIYAIVGVGLVVLAGWSGQISLGHAAFMAAGAYTHGILQNMGVGLLVSLPAAVVVAAVLGLVIGLPSLRVKGVYLAFATYAFAVLVEEVLTRWESVTGGSHGTFVDFPELVLPFFSYRLDSDVSFYYLALGLFGFSVLVAMNIKRSAFGRACLAVRDSETAALSQGINPARIKTAAFALSAAFAGLGGALYAHMLSTITPEAFTIFLSITLLIIIIVGGATSLLGAAFGAVFIVMLDQWIALLRDNLPPAIGGQTGFDGLLFGVIIILIVLFEPLGIYGRWVKIKTYFNLFPLYRKGSFARQRNYMASERNQ